MKNAIKIETHILKAHRQTSRDFDIRYTRNSKFQPNNSNPFNFFNNTYFLLFCNAN